MVNVSNAALREEIEAVNAIYGAEVAAGTAGINNDDDDDHVSLRPPGLSISFTLSLSRGYPQSCCPRVDGTKTTGSSGKGKGHNAVKILQETVGKVWTPGAVCLFDLVEEVLPLLLRDDGAVRSGGVEATTAEKKKKNSGTHLCEDEAELTKPQAEDAKAVDNIGCLAPDWTTSEPLTEKKSVFVARCAGVTDKAEAAGFFTDLFSTNKKVAAATHNITAWRIRDSKTGVSAQDCDNDGETAAGGRLLHLMQVMDVWNVVVVVTRWYGGIKLGADRFRLINQAARDALVKGGFARAQGEKPSKKKGRK
jgi:putative IMPACT (imprinted ancient) family translation regulator